MEETPSIPNANENDIIPADAEILEPAIETILNAAPEDKKQEVAEAVITIQREMYSGPIPHPQLLAEYERLQPGSTDRFLKLAEQQQIHRMELEKQAISSQLKSNERGQLFGFILSSLVITAGIVLFVVGMPWLGVVLIAGIIAVLAVLFLRGKVHIDADLKNKRATVDAKPPKE